MTGPNAWGELVARIDARPKPTPGETERLFRLARSGSEDARNRLVEANLRLVLSRCAKMSLRGSFDDNFQAGTIGLIRAIQKFDPGRGLQFSTYAVFWVDQAIRRNNDSTRSVINVPPHAQANLRAFLGERDRLRAILGREPEESEVQDRLDMSDRELKAIRDARHVASVLDLDKPMTQFDDLSLSDTLPAPMPNADQENLVDEAMGVLRTMRGREGTILRDRIGLDRDPMTLQEAGKKHGISRERVRQVESRAIIDFRKKMVRRGIIAKMPEPEEEAPTAQAAPPQKGVKPMSGTVSMKTNLKDLLSELAAKRDIYTKAIEAIQDLIATSPGENPTPKTPSVAAICSNCSAEKKRMKPCDVCGKMACRKCKENGLCAVCRNKSGSK